MITVPLGKAQCVIFILKAAHRNPLHRKSLLILLILLRVLLINSRVGVCCVFVVALCGFLCSTHPKQSAPTQHAHVTAGLGVWVHSTPCFLIFGSSFILEEQFGNYLDMINLLNYITVWLSPFYNYTLLCFPWGYMLGGRLWALKERGSSPQLANTFTLTITQNIPRGHSRNDAVKEKL